MSIHESLEDRPSIVIESARDRRIENKARFVHAEREDSLVHLAQLGDTSADFRVVNRFEILELVAIGERPEFQVFEDR